MKKIILILLILFSCLVMAVDKVKLVTWEWEPYTTAKKTESGFFTEIVSAAFKEIGIETEYKFEPWKRCEAELLNGTAFAAFPYIYSDVRKKNYDFSDAILNSRGVFFYVKSNKKVKQNWTTYSDLKEYKVGGTLGYWYEKAFQEANLNLDFSATDEIGMQKLYDNRIDILATEEVVGWEFIKKNYPNEKDKFEVMPNPTSVEELRLMISRKYPKYLELKEKFNIGLKKIKANGVYNSIIKRQ